MTPKQWRNMTIGKTYDIDGAYGAQCWDYFAYFVQYMSLNVSTFCALTGYVCDLWRLKDKYGYDKYFDYVQPGDKLQNGDWCFWDKGSSHNASHVAMYYDGQELGQNQGSPTVTQKNTTWDVMGALRLKTWSADIPAGASDQERNGHKYSLYRQGENEAVAVLSAGLNKLSRIQDLNADVWVMAKVTGANFFNNEPKTETAKNPDPFGTTYGDISAPLNDVWRELPNQNTTLYFDFDTGAFGDCTGIHIDPAHNVASPSVVYPATGNYQYARMIERNGDKGAAYLSTRSRFSFAIRTKDGRYIVGIAKDDLTPKEIADDWRTLPELETIQFFDGGDSAMFGRVNRSGIFEYVRKTDRKVPSAFAIISKTPYKPETKPIQDETQKDEEQTMPQEKPQEQPENVIIYEPDKIDGWTDPESTAETIAKRFLSVKSFVTLSLTAVFGYLSIKGTISPEQFMSVFTMCISFFFGYSFEKKNNSENGGGK